MLLVPTKLVNLKSNLDKSEGSQPLHLRRRFTIPLHLQSKEEVHRNANQNNQDTRNRSSRPVHEQNHEDDTCTDDIERGNDRIPKGSVRALRIRLQLA